MRPEVCSKQSLVEVYFLENGLAMDQLRGRGKGRAGRGRGRGRGRDDPCTCHAVSVKEVIQATRPIVAIVPFAGHFSAFCFTSTVVGVRECP